MSSEKLDEARARLRDALQAMEDILSPRQCDHGDWSVCDVPDCEWDDTRPIEGGAMMSDFVLVATWTGLTDGENYVGVHTGPKQLHSHTNGLLFTALYDV